MLTGLVDGGHLRSIPAYFILYAPVRDNPASITGAGAEPTASVALGLAPILSSPPCSPSLHDAEGQMRDACALDHPGELQLDRLGALFEQPDAIPE
jgi:hypothetical protein